MRLPTLPGSLVGRGVLGSTMLVVSGFMSSKLPPSPLRFLVDPLQTLGSTSVGHVLALLLVVLGMALLAHSWVNLVTQEPPMPETARVAHVRRAVVRWIMPLLIAPPLFSNDGWSYVAQGALAQAGRDPYTISPGEMPELLTSMVDPIWRYTPTPYGPLPITWGALCTEAVKDPTLLVLLHRVPALLGLALTAWAAPRLARRIGVDPARASALALGSPFVLAHGVGGLHNDALVMGLTAAALVLGSRRQWVFGCAVIGVAAAVKFTALVAVIPVVLVSLPAAVRGAGRLARLSAGGLTAALVVLALGLPYGLGIGWVRALSVPGVVVTPASIPTAVGWTGRWILTSLGSTSADYALPIVRSIGMALAVALVLVLALVRPSGDLRAGLRTLMMLCATVVFLAPVVHTWYALALVPAAALLGSRGRARRNLVILGSLFGFTAPLDVSLAGASLVVGAGVLLCIALLERKRQPVRLREAGP